MSFYPTHQIGRVLQHAGNKLLRHGSGKGIWIDVGAHHGEVTLSHAVSNPALIVYALEPNLRAASATFGRTPNYIVIPMAVAETDGCAQLHINAFDEASSLLTINEASRRSWKGGEGLREERVITVPTIRLDTFMDRLGIATVDFLKIDAQGSDLAVLRSTGKRLRDMCKITLEVDVSPNRLYQGSSSKEEVLSFLQASGFTLVATQSQSYGQEENLTFECSSLR